MNAKKKTRLISRQDILWWVIFFFSAVFLIKPAGVSSIFPEMDLVYKCGQLLIDFVALLLCLFSVRKGISKKDTLFFLLLFYHGFSFVASFFVNKAAASPFAFFLTPVSLLIICAYGVRYHKTVFFSSFLFYFEGLLLLQLLFQLLFPGGMFIYNGYTQNWIMGFKNYTIRYLTEGLCISAIYAELKQKNFFTSRFILYYLGTLIVIFRSESATGFVGLTVFTVLLFVFSRREIPTFLSIKYWVLYSAVAFLLIYFLRIQEYLSWFIVAVLHKRTDFTGRSVIWDAAFQNIARSPLFGIGLNEEMTSFWIYPHAHQYWLDIVLRRGLLNCSLLVLAYILASNMLDNEKGHIRTIITVTVASFMVMGIDEALKGADLLLPILVMAYEFGYAAKRNT